MKRISKWLLAFLKREWSVTDYPITVHHAPAEDPLPTGPGLAAPAWVAQIDGWLIAGAGSSKAEAMQDLARNFERYKARNRTLPRPGRRAPLQFAAQDRIAKLRPLADEFLEHVVGQNPSRCLITDRSSLHDFAFGHSVEPMLDRIKEHFGVDAGSVPGANIAGILELVAASRPN